MATQLLTQGQWWSMRRMQWEQVLQWWTPDGFIVLQRLQVRGMLRSRGSLGSGSAGSFTSMRVGFCKQQTNQQAHEKEMKGEREIDQHNGSHGRKNAEWNQDRKTVLACAKSAPTPQGRKRAPRGSWSHTRAKTQTPPSQTQRTTTTAQSAHTRKEKEREVVKWRRRKKQKQFHFKTNTKHCKTITTNTRNNKEQKTKKKSNRNNANTNQVGGEDAAWIRSHVPHHFVNFTGRHNLFL